MNNSADPYADLRSCVDQLVRLLATQPARLSQKEETDLNEVLAKLSDAHKERPVVKDALQTIANQRTEGRPNRHRLSAELMRVAGAVGAAGDVSDDASAVVSDAERLAEILVPALLV